MKKISFSILLMLFAAIGFAQKSSKIQTRSKTTSVTTSVTISNSDNAYKLSASFDRNVSKALSTLISDRLNQPPKIAGSVSSWISGEVYTLTLKENMLSIFLDKKQASQKMIKTFEKLGADAQQIIDGRHPKDQN